MIVSVRALQYERFTLSVVRWHLKNKNVLNALLLSRIQTVVLVRSSASGITCSRTRSIQCWFRLICRAMPFEFCRCEVDDSTQRGASNVINIESVFFPILSHGRRITKSVFRAIFHININPNFILEDNSTRTCIRNIIRMLRCDVYAFRNGRLSQSGISTKWASE